METFSNTVYWTYRIDDIFWNQLEQNFKKKQFKLSSFKHNVVRKGDIILIFKTDKNPRKVGFIAVCQVESDMSHNENGLKIFKDKNMNKFWCELSSVFILDNIFQLSKIKDFTTEFDTNSFRRNNIGENTMFIKLKESDSNLLVPLLTECMPEFTQIEEKEESGDEETVNEESENENNKNNYNHDNSDNDTDDIDVRLGHFPILFDPCPKFKWHNDINLRITAFKHHFTKCTECQQTDNNEISVISKFPTSHFHFSDLKTENKINELLQYYHNSKRYKLEFADEDKKYDHVIVHRINNPDNLYNGCCVVLW